MRCPKNAFAVFVLLLAVLAVAPLAAQPSTPPPNSHPLQRPPLPLPTSAPAAQIQNAPNVPTLVFDAESKRYDASPGEQVAPFTFNLTNVWTNEVIIDSVHASCGCTTASLPAEPWHLPPQGSGQIKAQVRLAGKMGLITKTLTFSTSVGNRVVYLNVNIPPPPAVAGTMSEAERAAARLKAAADAQAIFKGDCAKCHADKGRNVFGQDLYAADCGICHESSHRESMVPDLHALKQATDFDYWKTIITLGKPHTMMPGFAVAQGGPLTEAQIISLATYLNHTISHHLSSASTNAASASLLQSSKFNVQSSKLNRPEIQ
jgi:mono/diheme cytochrome c family protein